MPFTTCLQSLEGLQLDTVMAHFRRSSLDIHRVGVAGGEFLAESRYFYHSQVIMEVLSATQQSSDIGAEVALVATPNPVIFHNQSMFCIL